MLNLYKNIKRYRTDCEMSQDTLAKKTGYKSRTSIAKIEAGLVDLPQSKIKLFAEALGVSVGVLMGKVADYSFHDTQTIATTSKRSITINVLGRVAAGIPIEAIEDIIDTEEITKEMASTGDFFGLQIHGDSMEPRMKEGDVVIVRQQEDAESGDTVIALVNGDDATCKRLKKYEQGIMLLSNNPAYEPMVFSEKDVQDRPVTILGKVVELRAKF